MRGPWRTPPRPFNHSRRDTPRLTPASSDSSSTASPIWQAGRRRREDKSILRGAAVVRENILSGIRAFGSTDSEEQWSDPFAQGSETTPNEEPSTSQESFSQFPADEDLMDWERGATQPPPSPPLSEDTPPPEESEGKIVLRPIKDPVQWEDYDCEEVPPPSPPRRAASPTMSEGTPVTLMGRENRLRVKIVTYHVQRSDEIDDTTYDESYLEEDQSLLTFQTDYREDLADEKHACPQAPSTTPSLKGISPLNPQYEMLANDPAYRHAQDAGYLWQTLAGQHVRFPSSWWDGGRAPKMGVEEVTDASGRRIPRFSWRYVARHRVYSNQIFRHLVRNRGAPGRLLLHIVVRDLMTWAPVQDIAVGIYHPNARGIRKSTKPNPKDEDYREVWMAIRKRTSQEGAVSVVEPILCRGKPLDRVAFDSPLGDRRRVSNMNMRAVFGEKPPIHTIRILESELYERITLAADIDPPSSDKPALMLLQEFLKLG